MKVIVFENNYGEGNEGKKKGWYFLTDSAVTNTGKPFYKPENVGKLTVTLTVAVKISRLGKAISEKFANRYYSEYAPALHLQLPEFGELLKESDLSEDASRSFDQALFVDDFQPFSEIKEYELWVNGEKKIVWDIRFLNDSVDKLIANFSKMNTVKMGDLLLPGLSETIDLEVGDRLEVKSEGKIYFMVKVK